MHTTEESLEALQDIKRMMERSSRFISLSGWSGVSAGLCALAGAWYAQGKMVDYRSQGGEVFNRLPGDVSNGSVKELRSELLMIAALVLLAAVITAFLFTYLRSKRAGVPVWGISAQRLMWNTLIPLGTGGFFILRLLQEGYFSLIGPSCLLFYGLALINGSKYTLGEVRYLGYGQLLLGLVSLWMPGYALYFWAAGFGVLHIVYGILMWWKYERGLVG
jgi:hypothetical protein